jgi:hypothetical protein
LDAVKGSCKLLRLLVLKATEVDAKREPAKGIQGETMKVVVQVQDIAFASGTLEPLGQDGSLLEEHGGEHVAEVLG